MVTNLEPIEKLKEKEEKLKKEVEVYEYQLKRIRKILLKYKRDDIINRQKYFRENDILKDKQLKTNELNEIEKQDNFLMRKDYRQDINKLEDINRELKNIDKPTTNFIEDKDGNIKQFTVTDDVTDDVTMTNLNKQNMVDHIDNKINNFSIESFL